MGRHPTLQKGEGRFRVGRPRPDARLESRPRRLLRGATELTVDRLEQSARRASLGRRSGPPANGHAICGATGLPAVGSPGLPLDQFL